MPEKTNSSALVISLGSIVFKTNPIFRIIEKIKSQLDDIELNQNHINTIFGFFQQRTNVNDSKEIDLEFQEALPQELKNKPQITIDNILNIMHENVDLKHVDTVISALRLRYENIVFVTRSFERSFKILFEKIGDILPENILKSYDFNSNEEFLKSIRSKVLGFNNDVKYCCADWIKPICNEGQRSQLQDIING